MAGKRKAEKGKKAKKRKIKKSSLQEMEERAKLSWSPRTNVIEDIIQEREEEHQQRVDSSESKVPSVSGRSATQAEETLPLQPVNLAGATYSRPKRLQETFQAGLEKAARTKDLIANQNLVQPSAAINCRNEVVVPIDSLPSIFLSSSPRCLSPNSEECVDSTGSTHIMHKRQNEGGGYQIHANSEEDIVKCQNGDRDKVPPSGNSSSADLDRPKIKLRDINDLTIAVATHDSEGREKGRQLASADAAMLKVDQNITVTEHESSCQIDKNMPEDSNGIVAESEVRVQKRRNPDRPFDQFFDCSNLLPSNNGLAVYSSDTDEGDSSAVEEFLGQGYTRLHPPKDEVDVGSEKESEETPLVQTIQTRRRRRNHHRYNRQQTQTSRYLFGETAKRVFLVALACAIIGMTSHLVNEKIYRSLTEKYGLMSDSSVNETVLTVIVYGIPYLILALTLVGVWVYKRRVRLTAQREAVQRYRREYGSIMLP